MENHSCRLRFCILTKFCIRTCPIRLHILSNFPAHCLKVSVLPYKKLACVRRHESQNFGNTSNTSLLWKAIAVFSDQMWFYSVVLELYAVLSTLYAVLTSLYAVLTSLYAKRGALDFIRGTFYFTRGAYT